MKNQKGFIQIPLLIAIIAGVLVLGGVGYIGIKQYQSYQVKKVEKEKAAQEAQQQKDSEVEKLKQEVESLKKQQSQQANLGKQPQSGTKIIDSKDIQPYLPYVGQILCSSPSKYITGSGFVMNVDGRAEVITNNHVIDGVTDCNVTFNDTTAIPMLGLYGLDVSNTHHWNNYADATFLDMSTVITLSGGKEVDWGKDKYGNYFETPPSKIISPINTLKSCPSNIALGTAIAVIGYPITTQYSEPSMPGSPVSFDVSPRTVTFGTISAYVDSLLPPEDFPNNDYFTTAAVDSGNSGGLALAKVNGNVCLLGIPTWISQGNFQNQGVIQNINNITYRP